MAKSAFDTLVGILGNTDYTSTRSVNNRRYYLPETESIFLDSRVHKERYVNPILSSTRIGRLLEEPCKCDTPQRPHVFEHIEIKHKVDGFNFNSVYRYVCRSGNETMLKWVSDKGTYYVSRDMIFDHNKKLILGFDMFENKIIVEKTIVNGSDFMSKFIMNTFIPAYSTVFHGDVIITNLRGCTPNFHNRFSNQDTLDEELNNKLHYFSETFESI